MNMGRMRTTASSPWPSPPKEEREMAPQRVGTGMHVRSRVHGRRVLPLLFWRRLAFRHSSLVNPKGCQRVAGGRRGLWGGDLLVTAHEISCTPAGVPDRLRSLLDRTKVQLWHPSGVLALGRGFPVVVQGSGERPPATLWQPFGLTSASARLMRVLDISGHSRRAEDSAPYRRSVWVTRPCGYHYRRRPGRSAPVLGRSSLRPAQDDGKSLGPTGFGCCCARGRAHSGGMVRMLPPELMKPN
jgi:hypothetical protein